MIQRDMYGNFEWSSRPKMMLQSFSFFDESEEIKIRPKEEMPKYRKVVEVVKEKCSRAKGKVIGRFHKDD